MSGPTEFLRTQESLQNLLQDVWKFVCSLGGSHEDENPGSAWLVNQQWRHFKDACTRLLERSDDHTLGVAVVALTKSGKSTLLNALLGSTCLPTNNVPETARVCAIRHSAPGSIPQLSEPSGHVFRGETEIRLRLQQLNEEKRTNGNSWKMEPPLELLAPLYALSDVSPKSRISLVDTPGPNEAKTEFLRHLVEKLLEDIDAVIYVLDYTKLKTVEEADMLQDIQKINPSLVHRMWHRMFFVVNKFDVASTGQGLNEHETREYVQNLLRDMGFKVREEQILLVSANNALLSRLIITDKADDETRTKFGRLAFGMEFERVMEKREWKARAERMLENSGIPLLETQVLSFLYAHSGVLKQLSLLDDEMKVLQEVGNVANSFKGALSRSLGDMRAGMDRLKNQLDNTMMEFDVAKAGLLRIEEDVTVKVSEALHRLKHTLLTRVNYALSLDVEAESELDASPGWESIREDFVILSAMQELDSKRAENLLSELHSDVTCQIRSEIGVAWSMIEDLARERHKELIVHTNDHLDRLSHLIETVISKELGIHLDPVDITFKQPSTEEFREKFQDLLASGINKQVKERGSLCKYLLGPTYTVYTFESDSILEHFEATIREASERSLRAVQGLVKEHITNQVSAAESRLQDYSDRYMQAIQSAIDARIAHVTANASTMQRVLQDLNHIKKLKSSLMDIQRVLELDLNPNAEVNSGDSKECSRSMNSEECDEVDDVMPPPPAQDTLTRMGSGKLRYVPPRSRFQAQDAILAGTLNTERADSIPLSDMSDSFWESPRSGAHHRSREGGGGGHHWRNRSLGGGGGSGQFSPRSDFFRSFDRAYRGGKIPGVGRGGAAGGSGASTGGGRGRNSHRRTGSWA
ncbi:hypothetical protein BSKO_04521 [Bryopsis sp. KO-2023]|nr:hypothetical protein BSKO_04521 [Bryopsis sp. KO-2023]